MYKNLKNYEYKIENFQKKNIRLKGSIIISISELTLKK